MSRKINVYEVERLTKYLSTERLEKLAILTKDQFAAVCIHQDTLTLNSQLLKIVATFEIALRNMVYDNISKHFGAQNWLQQPPIALTLKDGDKKKIVSALDSAKRSEYAKRSQKEKAALKAAAFPEGKPKEIGRAKFVKKKREKISVSDGKVVAELTFGFWKRLYSPEYDHQLWRTTLKRTFPNKALKRAQVAAQLEIIYQMRNRLAHHEPVVGMRFEKLIGALQFVTHELDSDGQRSPRALENLLALDIENASKFHKDLNAKLLSYKTGDAGGPA